MFLEGREVFVDCGNGLEKVAVDDALKLIDRCALYASLTKNSKATPHWVYILRRVLTGVYC